MPGFSHILPINSDGHLTVHSMPVTDGVTSIPKMGRNASVNALSAPPEDIIAQGGLYYWPADVILAENIVIVSDSIEDRAAGTGAKTLLNQSLDGDYARQQESVVLNGTIPVNPTQSALRLCCSYVTLSGSAGGNVGNISIVDTGTNGTLAYIPAGASQALQGVLAIPKTGLSGEVYTSGYVVGILSNLIEKTNKTAEVVFYSREENSNTWMTRLEFGLASNSPFLLQFRISIPISTGADIRMTVVDAEADNLKITGGFTVILE